MNRVVVDVAVVTPAFRNQDTLPELARRLAVALDGRQWRLRIVVDASPDASLAVARGLAAGDARIAVTALDRNQGQHGALRRGLADEADALAWVCLDADLQDPPEAVPILRDRLAGEDGLEAVFAGRRGRYESRSRMVSGRLHRAAMGRVTGLPADAGAFVAMGPAARRAVLDLGGPSIVAAIGASGVAVASVPVGRDRRPSGRSSWTAAARARQSARTLAWSWARRNRQPGTASQRWTRVSE